MQTLRNCHNADGSKKCKHPPVIHRVITGVMHHKPHEELREEDEPQKEEQHVPVPLPQHCCAREHEEPECQTSECLQLEKWGDAACKKPETVENFHPERRRPDIKINEDFLLLQFLQKTHICIRGDERLIVRGAVEEVGIGVRVQMKVEPLLYVLLPRPEQRQIVVGRIPLGTNVPDVWKNVNNSCAKQEEEDTAKSLLPFREAEQHVPQRDPRKEDEKRIPRRGTCAEAQPCQGESESL